MRAWGIYRRWRERTHALTTNDIGEPTEDELTEDITDRSSNLDTEILVAVVGSDRGGGCTVSVHHAEHGCGDGNGEDVVGCIMIQ